MDKHSNKIKQRKDKQGSHADRSELSEVSGMSGISGADEELRQLLRRVDDAIANSKKALPPNKDGSSGESTEGGNMPKSAKALPTCSSQAESDTDKPDPAVAKGLVHQPRQRLACSENQRDQQDLKPISVTKQMSAQTGSIPVSNLDLDKFLTRHRRESRLMGEATVSLEVNIPEQGSVGSVGLELAGRRNQAPQLFLEVGEDSRRVGETGKAKSDEGDRTEEGDANAVPMEEDKEDETEWDEGKGKSGGRKVGEAVHAEVEIVLKKGSEKGEAEETKEESGSEGKGITQEELEDHLEKLTMAHQEQEEKGEEKEEAKKEEEEEKKLSAKISKLERQKISDKIAKMLGESLDKGTNSKLPHETQSESSSKYSISSVIRDVQKDLSLEKIKKMSGRISETREEKKYFDKVSTKQDELLEDKSKTEYSILPGELLSSSRASKCTLSELIKDAMDRDKSPTFPTQDVELGKKSSISHRAEKYKIPKVISSRNVSELLEKPSREKKDVPTKSKSSLSQLLEETLYPDEHGGKDSLGRKEKLRVHEIGDKVMSKAMERSTGSEESIFFRKITYQSKEGKPQGPSEQGQQQDTIRPDKCPRPSKRQGVFRDSDIYSLWNIHKKHEKMLEEGWSHYEKRDELAPPPPKAREIPSAATPSKRSKPPTPRREPPPPSTPPQPIVEVPPSPTPPPSLQQEKPSEGSATPPPSTEDKEEEPAVKPLSTRKSSYLSIRKEKETIQGPLSGSGAFQNLMEFAREKGVTKAKQRDKELMQLAGLNNLYIHPSDIRREISNRLELCRTRLTMVWAKTEGLNALLELLRHQRPAGRKGKDKKRKKKKKQKEEEPYFDAAMLTKADVNSLKASIRLAGETSLKIGQITKHLGVTQ